MTPPIETQRKRESLQLGFAGSVAAGLLLVGLLLAISAALHGHLNSDLLFPVAWYKDLLVDHVDVSRWSLHGAPYFFPDLALLLPLFLLAGDLLLGYYLYELLFFAVFVFAAYRVVRPLAPSGRAAGLAVLLAALWLIACMQGAHVALLVFFIPAFHSACIVIGLLAALLFRDGVQRGYSPLAAAAFVALTSATALSDMFFVVQFALPILVSSTVLHQKGLISRRAHAATVGLLCAAGVVTLAAAYVLKASTHLSFRGNPILENVALLRSPAVLAGAALGLGLLWVVCFTTPRRLLLALGGCLVLSLGLLLYLGRAAAAAWLWTSTADLLRFSVKNPMLWLPYPAALAVCAATLRRGLRARAAGQEASSEAVGLSLIFLTSAGLSTLVACLGGDLLVGEPVPFHESFRVGSIRHMQPSWVLSVVVLGAFCAARAGAWPGAARAGAVLGVLLFAALRILPGAKGLATAVTAPLYTGTLQCVDEVAARRGLQAGYGDFWTARYLTELSRAHVVVSQIALWDERMELQRWQNNPARYAHGPDGRYPRYGFFVVYHQSHQAVIERRFGPPAAVQRCGGLSVLIYDRQGDLAVRNFLRVPALIENALQLPSRVLDPPALNVYQPELSQGGRELSAAPLVLRFAPPASGDLLEVSLEGRRSYEVTVEPEDGPAATLLVPPAAAGLRARFLALPAALRRRPLRALSIRPLPGEGPPRIGHVFVYADDGAEGGAP